MKKQFFYPIVASVLIVSCTKDNLQNESSLNDMSTQTNESFYTRSEDNYVLGDTINIPYSIDNLMEAFHSLDSETKSSIDVSVIQPTHYYVRFKPSDSKELDILRNIKPRVFLSEVPLDREVIVHGSYYHDPSIPEDMPTYQYSTIPVERWDEISNLPVASEILIQAYIPDYDDCVDTKAIPAVGNYDTLLRKAYEMCGVDYEEVIETKSGSWIPSGRVRAYDTRTNSYIPIRGVRIRGTHLLKVKETLTDYYGEFELESFKNPVNMKIVWESDEWDIREGEFGQVSFDGPKLDNTRWNVDIGSEHEKNIRYAAMHRAAYRYYYDNINGLARPANTRKEKLCYFDSYNENKCGDYLANIGMGIIPDVRVWGKDADGDHRGTDKIFNTTAHELGHAAHCTWMSTIQFVQVKNYIVESWADFVEWAISDIEYRALGSSSSASKNQWWAGESHNYTPLFIDLVDTFNQGAVDASLPYDVVSGYTYSTLNTLLFDSYGLASLKTNLKRWKPSNVTDSQIDTLLSKYEYILQND